MLEDNTLVETSLYPYDFFIFSVLVIFSNSLVDTYLIFMGGNGWLYVFVKYCSESKWLEQTGQWMKQIGRGLQKGSWQSCPTSPYNQRCLN